MRLRSCGVSAFAVASLTLAFEASSAREITLDEALRRTQDADVRRGALLGENAAREADARQAAARPNPTLSLDVENWGGTGGYGGFGLAELSLEIAQTLELGGKRDSRIQAAASDRELADLLRRAREAEIAVEVRRRFADALALQAKRSIALDLEHFAERSREAVSARVRVGGASPVEARRAGVEAGAARLERARIERELDAAYGALAGGWGAASPDFDRAAGTLEGPAPPAPNADSLLARADVVPAVEFQRVRADRARADESGASAGRVPDLEVSGGVRRFEETDDFSALVSLGVPLPIADRRGAAVEAAQLRTTAADAELEAARREARVQVRALVAQIASAEEEAAALENDLLPEARRARDEAQGAYDQGLFRFTDVLDAERTLADLSMRAVDARLRARIARAELDGITGDAAPEEETP
jgi:cobalt-zinc-cadmium efflux system outer membrane protein